MGRVWFSMVAGVVDMMMKVDGIGFGWMSSSGCFEWVEKKL
jgi:hypothetical protein